MVVTASDFQRLKTFLGRHGVVIGLFVLYYLLIGVPATFVQVEVLSDPSGISNQQTFFGLNMMSSSDTSGIGVCRGNEIVWGSDIQKWLFLGWLFIARATFFVMFGPVLSYVAHYRMPISIFALVLCSITFIPLGFMLFWSRAHPEMPVFCNEVPRLQILYFIPNLIHLVLPSFGLWYINKRISSESPPVTDTTKGT